MSWMCPKCNKMNEESDLKCMLCGDSIKPLPTEPKHNIQSPDLAYVQPEVSTKPSGDALTYAGFWRRVAAYLIDFALLFTVSIFLIVLTAVIIRFIPLNHSYKLLFSVSVPMVIFLLVFWLYNAIMESSPLQATLGKMALGIVVTDMYGDRISFIRATFRIILKTALFVLQAFLGGYGMLVEVLGFGSVDFTKERQALHDITARTLVIKKGGIVRNDIKFYPKWGTTQTVTLIIMLLFAVGGIFDIVEHKPTEYQESKTTIETYFGDDIDGLKDIFPGEMVSYQNSAYHYELKYPKNWVKDEISDQKSVSFSTHQPNSSITISSVNTDGRKYSLDQLEEKAVASLKSKYPSLAGQIKIANNITFSENPAFSLTMPVQVSGINLEFVQYSVIHGNNVYIISTYKDNSDKNSVKIVPEIIDSFTFTQ